jgi:hypothetical protein
MAFTAADLDLWAAERLYRKKLKAADKNSARPRANELLWHQTADESRFAGCETLCVDGRAGEEVASRELARWAELFMDISGQFQMWDFVRHISQRLCIDLDPA